MSPHVITFFFHPDISVMYIALFEIQGRNSPLHRLRVTAELGLFNVMVFEKADMPKMYLGISEIHCRTSSFYRLGEDRNSIVSCGIMQ